MTNDNNETKRCPYCGEEIKSAAIKCRHCGEFLNKSDEKVEIKKGAKNNTVIIITMVAIVIITALIVGFNKNLFKILLPTDNLKSEKVEIFMTSSEKYSVLSDSQIERVLRAILLEDELTRQLMKSSHFFVGSKGKQMREEGFSKFLTTLSDKHLNDFDRVFNYENDYSHGYDKVMQRYNNLTNEQNVSMDSMLLVPIFDKNKEGEVVFDKVEIKEPSIPLIRLTYAGEGYFVAEINYNYLNAVYSKDLNKKFRDYLKLKMKEQNDRGNSTYVMDGAISVSKEILKDYIILWYKFSKKYPNFRKDEIDHMIMVYTADLIFDTYSTFNLSDNTMYPEAKQAYEELLNSIDKNSDPYKYVHKYYEILKENNFKWTQEFSDKYHKDFSSVHESYT